MFNIIFLFMALIELGGFRFEFGRQRKLSYPHTPELYPTFIQEGKPEIIEVTNENAYQLYITTAELYAVISRRGYLLASGVWKHYKTNGDKLEEVVNSEVVKLLENPNVLVNGNDFLRQWNENLLVSGNNYMYALRGFSSQEVPTTLNNITPYNVQIKTTGKIWTATKIEQIISAYQYEYDIEKYENFSPNEIIHSKMLTGINPIKGDTPLIALNMELSNIRAAKQFRNVIMTKNGALGMLTPKTANAAGSIPLTTDERMRIEKEYQKEYGTKKNQSKVLMAQTALDWVAMTYPTKDLMLFEEVNEDFKRIIDVFGLNVNIFSQEKASTFTNLAEGLKQAYQSTVIPDAEEKAMQISRALNLVSKGEFLALDYSKIPVLQENQKELSERLEKVANAVAKLKETMIYSDQEIREMASTALNPVQ